MQRTNGEEPRITIGDVRAHGIKDARKEARRLQALVDQGIDPRQEKQERIEEAAAKVVATKRANIPAMDAWRAYIAARTPNWSARHLADHETVISEGGKPRTRGRRPREPDVTQPGALRELMLLPLNQIDADRWFAAVKQIGNPVISAYLQCLLLTGARREKLAGVRWVDVDFQWNSITIHDKVEGECIILGACRT